jgi:TM2 domain-containing membrane protein YozV
MTKEKPVESNENQKNLSENNESTIENNPTASNVVSDKNYVVALIISYLVGYFGVDRFYVGKIGTGILKLLTFGGLGIWWLIDFLLIGIGKFKDKKGLPLDGFDTAGKIGSPIAIVLFVLNVVITVISIPIIIIITVIGIQTASNDWQRVDDLNALSSELEKVYVENGAYPSLEDVNNPQWRALYAPNITDEMLTDPSSDVPVLTTNTDYDNYGYRAVSVNGGKCQQGEGCASYTLTATREYEDEYGSRVITINSINY